MPDQRRKPGGGDINCPGKECRDGHTGISTDALDALAQEIAALRQVLTRLMESDDAGLQPRTIPRIASATVRAVRARHQTGGQDPTDVMTLLGPILERVERETAQRS